MGGTVQIDSAPGRGTRVTLMVPARVGAIRPPWMGPVAQTPAIPGELSGTTGQYKIRVLLADDHDVVRNGLARLLQMQPDIEVISQASDGQMAVDQVLQLRPDVVIMDVSMPRLSGMEATRRITAQLPGIRVIGLSMHGHDDVAAAMTAAGAVAYLAKTSPPESLIAAIRSCAHPAETSA